MTIFITISRGLTARNILQNEFYSLVKSHFEKVVLITTAAHDERFKNEFGAPNVEIIPMPDEADSLLDKIVSFLNMYLIFNKSTVGHGLYRYVAPPASRAAWFVKFLKFTLVRLALQPASRVTLARRAIQKFDYYFLQRPVVAQYRRLLAQYQPNIVFVANMLEETALLKAARCQQVPTMAMPKTWDNPSKRYFRARADHVIAWNSFMKEELMKLHDYRDNEITVVGVPQFDYYIDKSRLESREDFCRRLGLDPEKNIICLGSEGKVMPSDADIALVLQDLISNGKLNKDCQLLIRPHFGYKNGEQKFMALKNQPGVVIDMNNHPSQGFTDDWDYSKAQMDHFLNILSHADIVINTCSTLALDAAALGRPTIVIMFDGYNKKPFYVSCRRWYICDYFHELMRFEPALVADSVESLRQSINNLLDNPKLLVSNQRRLCERFCYHLDGNAGQRLFQKLINS